MIILSITMIMITMTLVTTILILLIMITTAMTCRRRRRRRHGRRPTAFEHSNSTRQDGGDQQGGRKSRKKNDLLSDCSLIATATSATTKRDKQWTGERKGQRTTAAGCTGGGNVRPWRGREAARDGAASRAAACCVRGQYVCVC